MAKHRTHSIEFKRQVAQDFIAGETLHGLNKHCQGLGDSKKAEGPSSAPACWGPDSGEVQKRTSNSAESRRVIAFGVV